MRFPDGEAAYAHLMVPHARAVAEGFLWPSLIISGIKAVLWCLCIPTLCCQLLLPLRALLLWLPVDLIHTAIFAANNANFAQVRAVYSAPIVFCSRALVDISPARDLNDRRHAFMAFQPLTPPVERTSLSVLTICPRPTLASPAHMFALPGAVPGRPSYTRAVGLRWRAARLHQ